MLGVVFMVASTLAGAFGGILMKLSHVVLNCGDGDTLTADEQQRRKRSSWAYFIVGAVIFQALLNVGLSAAALACAAQSLLSPFVSCQIVFNALLSPLLGERLTIRDVAGTLLIVAGCTLSGICAPKPKQSYTLAALLDDFRHVPFLIYLGMMGVLIVATYVGARTPSVVMRSVCAPALPGAFVGNANIFAKGAAGLVEEGARAVRPTSLPHAARAALPLAAPWHARRMCARAPMPTGGGRVHPP